MSSVQTDRQVVDQMDSIYGLIRTVRAGKSIYDMLRYYKIYGDIKEDVKEEQRQELKAIMLQLLHQEQMLLKTGVELADVKIDAIRGMHLKDSEIIKVLIKSRIAYNNKMYADNLSGQIIPSLTSICEFLQKINDRGILFLATASNPLDVENVILLAKMKNTKNWQEPVLKVGEGINYICPSLNGFSMKVAELLRGKSFITEIL